MNYNQYIIIFATICVYYYLIVEGQDYFMSKDCDSFEYNQESDNCITKNNNKRLYTLLPIALISMIGGFFIPNKTIGVAISTSGLLILLTIIWDNWYNMAQGVKLALMAATLLILIFVAINLSKFKEMLKIDN